MWIDWKDLESIEGQDTACLIKASFEKIKSELLLNYDEENALTMFIDKHVTCDKYNPLSEEIANKVNVHRHSRSCHKKSTSCRFNFPRLPSLKTIISVPARVLEKNEDRRKEIVMNSKTLLNKVKKTLENEEIMKNINMIEQKQFEHCKLYQKCVHKLFLIINENEQTLVLAKKDFGIFEKTIRWNSNSVTMSIAESQVLYERETENLAEIYTIEKFILKKRMLALLEHSKIANDIYDGDLITLYENALKVSENSYSVYIKRKTDETFINNYNTEWLNAWSANMDIQPALDYYSVITYISEYYRQV